MKCNKSINPSKNYKKPMRTLLLALLLILSTQVEASKLNVIFGTDSIPVTTPRLKTREDTLLFMIAILDNSERFWRQKAIMMRDANDSLQQAVNKSISAIDANVGEMKEVVEWVKEDFQARDEARVADISVKEKALRKERRQKVFWKTVAVIEGAAIVVLTIFYVI